MAAEDLARIYMRIDDDAGLRAAVAAGDFSGVGAADLDDTERRLLADAATEDMPDVAGFALEPGQKVGVWAPYHYVATQYITRNVTDPGVQASFLNWHNSLIADPEG
jgi:hypothetical protein